MRRRDCVWFSHGVSGAIKMLQEALPLSLQWWGITYWKLFLGVLPPNENSPLPPPRGRQNTTLVSLKMVHEGEHVRRKWSARVASSSDDLPACPGATRRRAANGRCRVWPRRTIGTETRGITMTHKPELCGASSMHRGSTQQIQWVWFSTFKTRQTAWILKSS